MKLVGSVFCVAALSLVGCADVETLGGGQMEGITPEKVSAVDPDGVPAPLQVKGLEQVPGETPIDTVCDGCVVVAFKVPFNDRIDEVRLVKDADFEVCRIYLKHDAIIVNECGSFAP